MDVERKVAELLAYICRHILHQAELELQRFARALEEWVNELLAHRLPDDWREQLHAYLDDWHDRGFKVVDEERPNLEHWIEGWARLRGVLPDSRHDARGASDTPESLLPDVRYLHPRNPNAMYAVPEDSELHEEDIVLAWELAEVAHRLRIAIRASKSAHDNPGFLAKLNDALNPYSRLFFEQSELPQQISDLETLLRHIEERFEELGYGQIEWSQFEFNVGIGIESAERVLHAGPAHGIRGVTVDTLFTAASIAGLIALARKVLARASARLTARLAKSIRSRAVWRRVKVPPTLEEQPIDDIAIDTYELMSRRSDLAGQAHHLNQTAAYGGLIPRGRGLSIKLEGNIFTEPESPHALAHRVLERFWQPYRGTDIVPTNLEYTRALLDSLRAARLPEVHVRQAVRAAIEERVKYGLLGGRPVPVVPRAIRNLQR